MYSSRVNRTGRRAVTIDPVRCVRGRLRVPGDKSISHRYALLAALAEGTSTIGNYAPGADCGATLRCLRALGVDIRTGTPTAGRAATVTVHGRGPDGLQAPATVLDAGNSGTTLRLLAGVLAAQPFESVITGDASLRRRPMRRIVDPLGRMGARIGTADGRPPLTIRGTSLRGVAYETPVASAQVKSATLLAGLHAAGTTRVTERVRTRDHTERALPVFGARIRRTDEGVEVAGGQRLDPAAVHVPGDPSSAAFWAAAAAALPGSSIEIVDVGLNPTRTAFLDVLEAAGADVAIERAGTDAGEPFGTVRVRHRALRPMRIEADQVPGLIDELPALAALASHGATLHVSGAAELRAKESDRIAVLAAGLRALGGAVDERPDGFSVRPARLTGGTVDACGDHRMAMAFAIAALGASGPTTITGHEVVEVSYPEFFATLESIRAERRHA